MTATPLDATAASSGRGATAASSVRRLVAKAVDPPRSSGGDVGHKRKLDSYAVEVCRGVGGWQ